MLSIRKETAKSGKDLEFRNNAKYKQDQGVFALREYVKTGKCTKPGGQGGQESRLKATHMLLKDIWDVFSFLL